MDVAESFVSLLLRPVSSSSPGSSAMGVSSSLLEGPLPGLPPLELCGWMLLAVDDLLSLFVYDENTLSLLALLLVETSESARAKTGLSPADADGSSILRRRRRRRLLSVSYLLAV